MENASLVGLSRQIALQRELDVVANNIANLNTTGFKADGVGVRRIPDAGRARERSFSGNDRRLSFVQDRATWHDISQGPVQQTGNPLDVAIDGNAFLVVQTPRGERYTRNGALQINATGQLVTIDGDRRCSATAGRSQFQPNDRDISISIDGTITVREGANTTDSQRGKLRLVALRPAAAARRRTAPHLPRARTACSRRRRRRRRASCRARSRNRTCSSVVEMTRMIEVTRTYTQIASMLQQQSDMRRTAIEKLAEVPA